MNLDTPTMLKGLLDQLPPQDMASAREIIVRTAKRAATILPVARAMLERGKTETVEEQQLAIDLCEFAVAVLAFGMASDLHRSARATNDELLQIEKALIVPTLIHDEALLMVTEVLSIGCGPKPIAGIVAMLV